MSYEPAPDPICEVCGRRLLPGEHETRYVTTEGREATVCELCKPRAEAAGWIPADRAVEMGGVGRERRRGRGGDLLGGLFGRRGRAAPERPRAGVQPAAPAGITYQPDPPGGAISVAAALGAFNSSNHRRTVRGLGRTLGEPRASGLLVKTSNGDAGARLTVAWELTWYQWEVSPGKRGLEVREAGKGETIDQLRAADRTWNLSVADDGTLSEDRGEGQEQE